ncbi:MAG: hypothetical protein AB1422_06070 [bacterium]
MSIVLNDQEILQLIQEKKTLPKEYNELFQMKEKRGHKERELTFKIVLRR